MCTVKTPKPVAQTNATEKKIQVLRNPYLDGIDPLVKARQVGVGSLRIDRSAPTAPSGSAKIARTTPTTGASPALVSLALNRSV